MKSHYDDIDLLIKQHIEYAISSEVHKNIEDSIFFSSYTISLEVFQNSTQKLKSKVKNGHLEQIEFLREDAQKFIAKHALSIDIQSDQYRYLLTALLKAQIKINEAIILHFKSLCKKAHSLDYLEERAEQICKLLCDE
ncbi:MAG: hypothetical protein J0647_05000 [Campylobacteraceae bacterium]|nr:hypothetical protein [Campylobacteraceae bacterium]